MEVAILAVAALAIGLTPAESALAAFAVAVAVSITALATRLESLASAIARSARAAMPVRLAPAERLAGMFITFCHMLFLASIRYFATIRKPFAWRVVNTARHSYMRQ